MQSAAIAPLPHSSYTDPRLVSLSCGAGESGSSSPHINGSRQLLSTRVDRNKLRGICGHQTPRPAPPPSPERHGRRRGIRAWIAGDQRNPRGSTTRPGIARPAATSTTLGLCHRLINRKRRALLVLPTLGIELNWNPLPSLRHARTFCREKECATREGD
jgi:hypothetical protein